MQGCLSEERATQIAAKLLEKHDEKMKYLKLIKLLYIIDRQSLRRHGYPLTGDTYYSLPHGPIVSEIQDLITDDPEFVRSDYWKDYIKTRDEDVILEKQPSTDLLSSAASEIIEEVDNEYGRYNRWELSEITEGFPEYEDPGKSRIEITYEDILKAVGKKEEAKELSSEIEDINFFRKTLKC